VHVFVGEAAQRRIRHDDAEPPAVVADALADRAHQLFVRPAARPGLGVGSDVRRDLPRPLVEDVAGAKLALDGQDTVVVVQRRVAFETLADRVRQVAAALDGGRAVLRGLLLARGARDAGRQHARQRKSRCLHS